MIPNEDMKDDTIPVRDDEKFDEDILAKYLIGKIPGIDATKKLKVRQFGGGAANLTYLLDYGDKEYVLRRPPLGPVAKSSHDMGREYKALSVLYQEFSYAPQAFHYCDDIDIIGAPFFIMERKKGLVIRNKFPEVYWNDLDAARKISESLVDALVDFHAVDYKKIGLENLGKPDGFIDRQIEGWYKRWNAAKQKDDQQMDGVYKWLQENNPNSSDYSIIHNDYKLDNVMFDNKDPSKMVAVFDWDMCTLGDPLSDLGALITYWYEPTDSIYLKQIAMMPTKDLGFMTRSELVSRYAEKSGRSVEQINFYHTLGLFRLVVIIAQIYIRYVKGQTKDDRFAGLGLMIPILIQAAHDVAYEKN